MHLQVTHIYTKMQTLNICQAAKEEQIGDLQKKMATLEADADKREQYTIFPNLRFHGIPEVDGKNTNVVVISTIRKKIGLTHIGADHLERSHTLGPKQDEQGRSCKRAVIVWFRSEAVRDEVFRARTRLNVSNRQNKDDKIHGIENLTAK